MSNAEQKRSFQVFCPTSKSPYENMNVPGVLVFIFDPFSFRVVKNISETNEFQLPNTDI